MKKVLLTLSLAIGLVTASPTTARADDCAYLAGVIMDYINLGYDAFDAGNYGASDAYFNGAIMIYEAGLGMGCAALEAPNYAQAE